MEQGSAEATSFGQSHAAAARVFAVLWALMHMVEMLAWPFWLLRPWGWLLFFAAMAVLLRPSSVPRFAVLVSASFGLTFGEMPFVPNHVLLTWIQNGLLLSVLLTLRVRRRSKVHDSGEWIAVFAPMARAQLIALYLLGAVQKLNADYLDPAVSCAAQSYRQIATDLHVLPLGEWTLHAAIYGSLVAELAIPMLLVFSRTRKAGVIAALLFHGLLGFHENAGVFGFSTFMFVQLALFLPAGALVRLSDFPGWRVFKPLKLTGGRPIAWLCIICFFGVVRAQAWMYWHVGMDAQGFMLANRSALGFWLTLSLWLAFAYVVASRGRNVGRELVSGARSVWIGAAVGLIVLNAAMPWVGCKTQTSFSMFSNLRTEFAQNHLFLRRVSLIGFQDEMVEVLSSEPDIFDLSVNPHSVQQHANEGAVIAMFELRRLAHQVGGPLEIEFVHAGERKRAARDADGVVSGAVEVFDSPGFWARKFLWFRRHTDFGGPMCCTH